MDIRQKSAQVGLHLRRLQLRLGWLGVFAGLLLGLAALEWFSVILPAAQSTTELEAQVLRLRESSRNGREIKRSDDNSPALQIAAFERFFPTGADINQVLGKIYAAADREKLLLEHGEYRLSEESGLSLLRYQISLPVKGSQSEIKLFIARILQDIPALSLDGISMQRQNVGETVIAAQIRVSVFFQGNR